LIWIKDSSGDLKHGLASYRTEEARDQAPSAALHEHAGLVIQSEIQVFGAV
jgi:hypothetical protein